MTILSLYSILTIEIPSPRPLESDKMIPTTIAVPSRHHPMEAGDRLTLAGSWIIAQPYKDPRPRLMLAFYNLSLADLPPAIAPVQSHSHFTSHHCNETEYHLTVPAIEVQQYCSFFPAHA